MTDTTILSTPVNSPIALLIVNATILTMDGNDQVISNGAIAIAGNTIVDVGPTAEVEARCVPRLAASTKRIDAKGGIVLPGFVNLHAHLAMTMFRGWADDRDLQGFLDRLFPAEAAVVSPDMIRVGSDLAFAESLLAGITTTLDMYFYPTITADSAEKCGARIVNGPVIFDFPGPENLPYPERVTDAREQLIRGQQNLTAGRSLSAHSTYTVSIDHLVEVHALAQEFDALFNIHAAENAAEVAMVIEQTGRRPVKLLHEIGLLGPKTILAHCVDLTDEEIELISASGASVAHNPLSNMKLASGFAPVTKLQTAGATVALGTDGPASSNDLDIYMALRFAAMIHKGHALDARQLSARSVLRMATIDGANALGLGQTLGSIEINKRADLQILAHDHPNLTPAYDPISTVVFAAGRADVRTVIVDGSIVVDDHRLTRINISEVLAATHAVADAVRATA